MKDIKATDQPADPAFVQTKTGRNAAGAARKTGRRQPRRHARFSLTLILTLLLIGLGLGFFVLAFSDKSIRLPTWVVADVEARLNRGLLASRVGDGIALSVGGVEFAVDRHFVPRFRLEDLRLISKSGRALLRLPEAQLALDPEALLSGQIRPSSLRLIGARLAMRRDESGRIDLRLGGGDSGQGPKSVAEVLDGVHAILALPVLSRLRVIEAEGLSLTLTDARAGRSWDVGDGRLVIENRPDTLSAELGMSLLDGSAVSQATLAFTSSKADRSARLTVSVDQVAAADIAAFSAPLGWLALVDAPISGRVQAALDGKGSLSDLRAELDLGAGLLRTSAEATPVAFEKAGLKLSFDPAAARITLRDLTVDSASLRLRASGHSDLLDAGRQPISPGEIPDAFRAQIAFSQVMVDPKGLFVTPVKFSQGALDLRLRLNPFRLDIGQLALVEDGERLLLSGHISETPNGAKAALDVSLDQISTDRLVALWPVLVVPNTRTWLATNVGQGTLFNVKAALRLAPGQPPGLSLGYEFSDAAVRFVRTLPPILDGAGHATIENNTYTIFLDRGHVAAPEGGEVKADGTVFQVPDIRIIPASARVRLVTSSTLTAVLSLLDQEPFRFLTKADQPVDLGDGRADLVSDITMPLKPRITFPEITFDVTGTISDFQTGKLVPGRTIEAPVVDVKVDAGGLRLSGKGTLGKLPFDVTYLQGFGPENKGKSRVNGIVDLSDTALRDLGIELPADMISGTAKAAVGVALVKGEPPRLSLTSTLTGMGLRIDALGWSKPANATATLDAEAILGPRPVVENLSLAATGLTAKGSITTREGGGLDAATFTTVKAGGWFDAAVRLGGRGRGKAVDIAITKGTIDMRSMPKLGTGGSGGPLSLTLDRLVISKGIALTGLRGTFSPGSGMNGRFVAAVNGQGSISGVVAPAKGGTAVRIQSDNAGTVVAAAGIFDKGRGGGLDLTLTPRGPSGQYNGRATFTNLRVQDAPALASLLSAVSVVGLLEQMNGEGLAFSNGEVDFILTPDVVEITQGSATGASLGISMAGLYDTVSGRLNLQGVISPIYLVNGIGAVLTRRGEGLFGFNYSLKGTADKPEVSVNPLSILTPGMFREIFRSGAPNLKARGQ